jgi:hypothetical protein
MAREISAVLRCELREGHGDHRGPARQALGRDTHAHGFCAKAREGVDHWVAPLRARVEGLKSLKQLSEVRLLHPLMLRQALKVVQHVCVHPVISALGLDTIAALHAELQDWKSLLQTRTLWLPALQGDCAGLIDCKGGIPIRPWLPGTARGGPIRPGLPGTACWASATASGTARKSPINNNMDLVMEIPPTVSS